MAQRPDGRPSAETLRERIRSTVRFQNLDEAQQSASLGGVICPRRGLDDLLEAAGIDTRIFRSVYACFIQENGRTYPFSGRTTDRRAPDFS
jgi:hypothetical protein